MIIENIKLAFGAMRGSKMRTLLSLLGIIIGVGSVVAILTIGDSASKSITDSISVGGLDMVTIYPAVGQRSTGTFTEEFGDTLMRDVEGIEMVLPQNSSNATVRNNKQSMNATVTGVLSGYGDALNLEYAEGGFFSSLDNINRRQVVVLGSSIAAELFPEGPALGGYVSVFRNQAKSYLVVGVLESKDATFNISYDNSIFIPYNTFEQRFRKNTSVGSYVLKIAEGYDTIEVSDKVTEDLDSLVGTDGYSLFSPASLAEMATEITSTFSAFLAAIAAISLLVGGIGIMNIMIVTVTERRKEIGIRKALGATPNAIRMQFLVESATISLFGGVFGIIFGLVLSAVATYVMDWAYAVQWSACLIAFLFSAFVGVFFGLNPAARAAKLDPVEALASE